MLENMRLAASASEDLERISESRRLSRDACVRAAFALALRSGKTVPKSEDEDGLEVSYSTVFGGWEEPMRSIMEMREGRRLSDAEFWPDRTRDYVNLGIGLLAEESRYTHDLTSHLATIDRGV